MCRVAKQTRANTACLAMLIVGAAAVQISLDGPKKKKQAPACPPQEDLTAITKYGGAGGNAYVLIVTGESKCLKQGEVLKVYAQRKNTAEQISALGDLKDKLLNSKKQFATKTMVDVVESCGIASVPSKCKDNSDRCLFSAACVNVPADKTTEFDDRCRYMVFESAGSQTLETCIRKLKTSKDLKKFVLKALEKLMCLHSAFVYHGDFQFKNLMTDSQCDPDAIKIVDVDDINKMNSNAEKDSRDAHELALKDLLDLLGTSLADTRLLLSSSYKLEEWVSSTSKQINLPKLQEAEMDENGIEFARKLDDEIKNKLMEFVNSAPNWDQLKKVESDLKTMIEKLDE